MEKEYKPKNDKTGKVNEPTLEYHVKREKKVIQNPDLPCIFTDEEKSEQIKQGIKDMEQGLGRPIEEVFAKYTK